MMHMHSNNEYIREGRLLRFSFMGAGQGAEMPPEPMSDSGEEASNTREGLDKIAEEVGNVDQLAKSVQEEASASLDEYANQQMGGIGAAIQGLSEDLKNLKGAAAGSDQRSAELVADMSMIEKMENRISGIEEEKPEEVVEEVQEEKVYEPSSGVELQAHELIHAMQVMNGEAEGQADGAAAFKSLAAEVDAMPVEDKQLFAEWMNNQVAALPYLASITAGGDLHFDRAA